jgi:hypothetical protein
MRWFTLRLRASASKSGSGLDGIEQEFLVSLRAEDGAFHYPGDNSEPANGFGDAPAGGLMQPGVAHDAAFADLPFAHLELRLD